MNKLNNDDEIKCGWCAKVSTAEEWDIKTLSRCDTREKRRTFKSISNIYGYSKGISEIEKRYYMCPKCGAWQEQGNTTITKAGNKEWQGLGGVPVYRIVSDKY